MSIDVTIIRAEIGNRFKKNTTKQQLFIQNNRSTSLVFNFYISRNVNLYMVNYRIEYKHHTTGYIHDNIRYMKSQYLTNAPHDPQ